MKWFERQKKTRKGPTAPMVQVRREEGHPFSALNGYQPLAGREVALYRSIREAVPVVDAAEARHGRWRQNDNGTWSCSECSSWIEDEQHHYARFCLHCGAKMDG